MRSRNDLNCFISATDQSTKIHIDKITWWVPHVNLEDVHKLKLLQVLNNNVPITMSFRTWDLYELPLIPQTKRQTWSVKTSTDLGKQFHQCHSIPHGARSIVLRAGQTTVMSLGQTLNIIKQIHILLVMEEF